MEAQKAIFVYGGVNESTGQPVDGAIKRGVPEDVAIKIYDNMKPFARYAFNKSHAAAYAVLAYQTAYLKRYYEVEFFCSILNNRIDKIEELSKYLSYLKSKNISVLTPDINKSKAMFSCENGGVRFGLVGLKNVGLGVIESIIQERDESGEFSSFEDFINRCIGLGINKRLVESLILSGGFDCFKINRRTLMTVYGDYMERVSLVEKKRNEQQISMFGTLLADDEGLELEYPKIDEFSSKEKLTLEKTVLGIYLSGHPLSDYREQFSKFSFNTSVLDYYEEDEDENRTYTEIKDGEHVVMGGIVTEFKKLVTKSGQTMAFTKVEDINGQIEVICFPKVYERCIDAIKVEQIVKVSGKLQVKGNEVQIIADGIETLKVVEQETPSAGREYMGIIVLDDMADRKDEILDILASYVGDIPVIVALKGKKYSANCAVRKCEGLISELKNYVPEKDIIFFTKKT